MPGRPVRVAMIGLDEVGDRFGVERRYPDYRELLEDPDIDAVHLNSPIPDHAWMTIEALEAGKHVACTVPMATSVEDCERIVAAVDRTGRTYMMMETAVYAREYLYLKQLHESGELGRLQFLRAWSSTTDRRSRSRPRTCGFATATSSHTSTDHFAERLPEPIRRFTTRGVHDDGATHLSFTQGAGHGGSHPHLVHEFVSALVEQREPFPNARRAANWTCVGLCAHESALRGGELVRLPEFTLNDR